MSDNQTLSVPFTDHGSAGGAFRAILKKFVQSSVDTMLPVSVGAVDAARNYATVKIALMVCGTDGSTTSRGQIANVPIFTLGGGGFLMSWPIKAGDLGWLIAADRDISLFVQNNAETIPNTDRQHSFSDGVFLPDAARRWALSDEDADNAVWQSYDGTTKITLGSSSIKLKHPTLVELECPTATMSGDLTVQGTITGKTDVIAGTISGKTHTHPGVTAGGASTGEPVG